jgi:hypothetical protein
MSNALTSRVRSIANFAGLRHLLWSRLPESKEMFWKSNWTVGARRGVASGLVLCDFRHKLGYFTQASCRKQD